ncbi:MAG TPA: ABC transporter ATP-binding protein [Streptosporangiaceae bacterium]|nr:ABC transporter ATP-binding protein [Streptosporangiaceae bacterium]
MTSTAQITIGNLGKTYPGGNEALRDVSISVESGTFLVLLGPSGSGKTTLLRCLAGIERISTGRITVGGRVVADGRAHMPPDQRELSMVFQDYALWPHMSALDNVAFALRRRHFSRAECRTRAAAMLDRVGLGQLAARFPNELSGGEQQRVALARALIAGVGLILCDEPLSNLDADLRERMRVEISTLVREAAATTVYITHDQAEAFALADHIGVLEEGVLVQAGTPEDVYHHPATPFVARFTGLAGELRVTVTAAVGDGALEITAADGAVGRLPVMRPAGAAGRTLRPGDGAVLAIRPTGVFLAHTEADERHLSGRVADVAFRGRGYEYAIDLPGLGRLTGVFARHRASRGDEVGLRLDPEGCHLFPADDTTPADASAPVVSAVSG